MRVTEKGKVEAAAKVPRPSHPLPRAHKGMSTGISQGGYAPTALVDIPGEARRGPHAFGEDADPGLKLTCAVTKVARPIWA